MGVIVTKAGDVFDSEGLVPGLTVTLTPRGSGWTTMMLVNPKRTVRVDGGTLVVAAFDEREVGRGVAAMAAIKAGEWRLGEEGILHSARLPPSG